jgi:phage shock protein C
MRRLYRSQNDRIIAGVCGGLGIHFGISPLLFRVLFILLSAAGGFAVPLYLIMWIVIPDAREVFTAEEQRLDREVTEHKSDTTRLNPTPPADWTVEPTPRGRADWPVLIGVVLVAIGLMVLLRNLGLFSWLRVLAPVAVIALGIALLIEVMNRQP